MTHLHHYLKPLLNIGKLALWLLCMLVLSPSVKGQAQSPEALRDLMQKAKRFMPDQVDSAIAYSNRAVMLAEFEERDKDIVRALRLRGEILMESGKHYDALPDLHRCLEIEGILRNHRGEAKQLISIGDVYLELDTLDSARASYNEAIVLLKKLIRDEGNGPGRDQKKLGQVWLKVGQVEELAEEQMDARKAYREGLKLTKEIGDTETEALINLRLGFLYVVMKRQTLARGHFRDALAYFETELDDEMTVRAQYGLALVHRQEKKYVVAEDYARRGLKKAREIGSRASTMDLYQLLGDLMQDRGQHEDAADYYQLNILIRDSMLGNANARQLSDIVARYEKEKLKLENEKKAREIDLQKTTIALAKEELEGERLRFYAILGGLILVALFGAILARAVVLKNRANRRLQTALDNLQRAQDQLIRTEKLASLGQVTAGIAHEIRNPLNFVNSLSRLSVDMVDEAAEELTELRGQSFSGTGADAVFEYFHDIRTNSGKVLEHGQRAGRIVTDMLRHAATGDKEKESVSVNQFVEEYMQVAFHSMRGKPSAFDCAVDFVPDESLTEVQLVRADMGRALLNIVGNAFEALEGKISREGSSFGPALHVSTSKNGNWLEIKVRDNGSGVPDDIKEKIFEPFFTTKPPNEGTGLGLSLAYETIVSGHQGQLIVNDAEGSGAEFLLRLPLK